MTTASNIGYEPSGGTRAIAPGGIWAVHLLTRKVGLIQDIDWVLHLLKQNPPYLELLTFADRFIDVPAIGIYACDGASHWGEIHFMETGARELTRRLDAIEARLAGIEARVGKE